MIMQNRKKKPLFSLETLAYAKYIHGINYKKTAVYEIKFFLFPRFRLNPTIRHTFWNLLCGAAIGWMAIFGISQASVQRYSALPTLKKAR